ncbi:late embryogenesis abundant protein 1-like [Cynara cardunculus var. scolymus]|uniref:late embryogenesis abundant protein 1-like n=1 Tax=Cynara cardunculus var. scolymus TaxID=59895 RepID=UPI000D624ACA|nr:late embryogenesis abundant protein 1-like [Cynara cardunculus var. scolymus]
MASQDQRYRAGEVKGQAEDKTKDHLTSNHLPEMGQSTTAGKKKTGGGGVMQRTGDQVKSMAQGAAEKVKQSFGMAEEEEEEAVVGGKTGGAPTGRTTTRKTTY